LLKNVSLYAENKLVQKTMECAGHINMGEIWCMVFLQQLYVM